MRTLQTGDVIRSVYEGIVLSTGNYFKVLQIDSRGFYIKLRRCDKYGIVMDNKKDFNLKYEDIKEALSKGLVIKT